MQFLTALGLPPQWAAAILIAAPMLACGAALALLVTRVSAWYARRWRATTEEVSLDEQFLTDRLFSTAHYGILAAPTVEGAEGMAKGGRQDDRSEA